MISVHLLNHNYFCQIANLVPRAFPFFVDDGRVKALGIGWSRGILCTGGKL